MGCIDKCTVEQFLSDVKKHEMKIVLDDGVNRHIKFRDTENFNCHFEITTWDNHLCISGDMGCSVFSRVEDMFMFFRRDELSINPSYWHEKLVSQSKYGDGARVYSQEAFEEQVKHDVDSWLGDAMPGDEVGATLWEEINEQVLSEGEFECEAFHAANDFESETDFEFCDFWENDFKVFTLHFIWRLYAIVWGIQQYDALKDNAGQDARVAGGEK